MQRKNIPCKILLVSENTPGHPQHIGDMHPDVKIVSLPPNTTALIQLMDKGIVATFKAYNLQCMFAQGVGATESDITLWEYWEGYNILDGIKNTAAAWEDITEECMRGVRKKIFKT